MYKDNGKKVIESYINDVFLSMHFKDVFTDEFLDTYIKCEDISNMIRDNEYKDTILNDIGEKEIESIEYILKSENNSSNIYSYNELKDKAKEYLILKRMSDLNII